MPTSPSIRTTAVPGMWRWGPGACGRRPTPASPGSRSSTISARTPSASSPSTLATPRSSGWVPARTSADATSAGGMAFTVVGTAVTRGTGWVWRPRSTSARFSSTRGTVTSCWWRRRGRYGRLAASAAFTRRPMAARPGPRCSRSMSTPASPTWSTTPRTPTWSTPRPTSGAGMSGRSSGAARAPESTNRPTPAIAGGRLPRGSLPETSARSGSR